MNRATPGIQTLYRAGRLVKLGIISEITGQKRHRRFRYEPYIQLFNDSVTESIGGHT